MTIGIDKLGFYSPSYIIDMRELANARGIEPDKFTIGLGQDFMAVPPITQDTITLGANAAHTILTDEDKQSIDLVILATESGIDYSKAGATTVHSLLGINPSARSIELKQACYAATAGIQLAKNHIASNPGKKALVIASDISRYGLNTAGEPTQGAGAVAILLSENPKLIALDDATSYHTEDIHDFYRPMYSDVAIVDGKYSNDQYQHFFETTYTNYLSKTQRTLNDFKSLCFHIPYTKIGLKALKSITEDKTLIDRYVKSTHYNRMVGNIYTGSLYLNLLSLLHKVDLEANDRIGLYSYGSGAVAEFFSGTVQEGYQDHLQVGLDEALSKRTLLTIKEYEAMYNQSLVNDGSHQVLDTKKDDAHFQLSEVKHHQRFYISK